MEVIIPILLLCLFFPSAHSICYYPDGTVSSQDTPCQDESEQSTCCGQGYACLSNNICIATGDEIEKPGASTYVRGSCTDKNWRSSSCPSFCINGEAPNYDLLSGGMGIEKCANTTEDMYYCIDSGMEDVDCGEKKGVLSFQGQSYHPLASIVVGYSKLVGTPTVLTTIGVATTQATPTMSTSSLTSSPATGTSLLVSNTAMTTLRVSNTATTILSAARTTATTTALASTAGSHATVGIAVGASVGGSGVIALCAVAVYIWRRKSRRLPSSSQTRHSYNATLTPWPPHGISEQPKPSELPEYPSELPGHPSELPGYPSERL